MRLAFPSFALLLYIFTSLIWWLPCRPWIKIAAACTLLAIGSKYILYEKIGGSFIAPTFAPSELLISRDFATIPIRKTGGGRCLETSFALRSIPRGDAESLH
ncbi:MAG: hypothetical protein PHI97_06985, partial [Desulfobulbus sp.]|nr:hypothetical protein [Desulfobulbus sp.]